jgi:hypothetical protein
VGPVRDRLTAPPASTDGEGPPPPPVPAVGPGQRCGDGLVQRGPEQLRVELLRTGVAHQRVLLGRPQQREDQGRVEVADDRRARGRDLGRQVEERDRPGGTCPPGRPDPCDQLAVGHHVGPADVQGLPPRPRVVDHRDQQVEQVRLGDRLGDGPGHRRVDGQRGGRGRPQQLERRAARPDDDAGPQLGHRHRPVTEGLPRLLPGEQVRRGACEVLLVDQAAEVDDASDPARLDAVAERGRRPHLALEQTADPVLHPVDQVVGRVRPVRRAEHRPLVLHGTGHHPDLVAPGRGQPARVADQAADAVPSGEQPGHEPPPDVAGRAGHEDVHGGPSGGHGRSPCGRPTRCQLPACLRVRQHRRMADRAAAPTAPGTSGRRRTGHLTGRTASAPRAAPSGDPRPRT